MINKIINLIFVIIILTSQQSCGQSEKSNEFLKKANEVYYTSRLDEKIKIDSSLYLTNKAIEINDQNINAYIHKSTLLFRMKNIDELINVSEKLISLRPDKPIYLGQKAFYLELKGETEEAKLFYQKSINNYKKFIEKDSLNFDIYMEYIGILESSNDSNQYNQMIAKLKKMNFNQSQKEIIDAYQTQHISKTKLLKFWNGEISYEDIGNQ